LARKRRDRRTVNQFVGPAFFESPTTNYRPVTGVGNWKLLPRGPEALPRMEIALPEFSTVLITGMTGWKAAVLELLVGRMNTRGKKSPNRKLDAFALAADGAVGAVPLGKSLPSGVRNWMSVDLAPVRAEERLEGVKFCALARVVIPNASTPVATQIACRM
jgi:hypothetical protein